MPFPRRRLLIGGAALTALTACGYPVRYPGTRLIDAELPPAALYDQLAALEDRHNGFVGVYGLNLIGNRTVAHRGDELFATCSTFKAYLAARILQLDQLGKLRLSDSVFIDPAIYVEGNSPVAGPHVGGELPLTQLAAAAVRLSDNTAANVMLGLVGGPSAVTDFARSVGDDRTWMVRWEPELNSAIPGDPRDTSTPRAMGTGFLSMLTGPALDDVHRAQLDEWMRTMETGGRSIRAGLPSGWVIADKTGAGDYGTTNDIGVADGPNGERLLLAIMTKTRSGNPNAEQLYPLIAEATALVVPWLIGQD